MAVLATGYSFYWDVVKVRTRARRSCWTSSFTARFMTLRPRWLRQDWGLGDLRFGGLREELLIRPRLLGR